MPTKPEIAASQEEVDDIYNGSTEDSLPPELQKIIDAPKGDAPAADEQAEQPQGEEPNGDEQPTGDEGEQTASEGSEGAAGGSEAGGEAEGTEGAAAPVKDKILTAEEIRAIAAQEREEFLREQEANKPAPPLTPEEIKKLLNPIEITKEEVMAAFGVDPTPEQMKALEAILNKPVRNATALANLMAEQKLRKLEQTFAPIQAQHAEVQIKETRNAFHARHPAMKKYDELVAVATQQVSPVKANGKQKSRDEIFDDVAAHVTGILAKSGVKLEAKPTVNPEPAKGNAVPKMAARQQPGRSVGSQSKGKQNNPDDDIYEG